MNSLIPIDAAQPLAITNEDFLIALVGDCEPHERLWLTSFAESPEVNTPSKWAGRQYAVARVGELPESHNNYFSVSLIQEGTSRRKDNFRRQFVLVLDDPDLDALVLRPTYLLQTSEGKHQAGYKLVACAEARNEKYMSSVTKLLVDEKLIPKDKSGNSTVRYVRLPVGTNTKERAGNFRHRLLSWHPELAYTPAQVLESVGITIGAVAGTSDRGADSAVKMAVPVDVVSDAELVRQIISGESYHDPVLKLTARYAARGMTATNVLNQMQGIMLGIRPAEGTIDFPRWKARFDDIARMVKGAAKFHPSPATGLRREGEAQKPILDEANVRIVLDTDPNLVGLVSFNEFSGELLLNRPVPVSDPSVVAERDTPRRWRDSDTALLTDYIQRTSLPRIARDKVGTMLEAHAQHACPVHPLRDYLESLAWDGTPRVREWLTTYCRALPAQDADYLRGVGQAWLVSAVARVFKPGCQVDSALVLEGRQGAGKTSALRILAGDEWFSDSLPVDLHNKDAQLHLRGRWIVELPELAQFRRTEIETVKAFLSRREEKFRPPYGRTEVTVPRQCVFAGSTNAEHYLVDSTGNRRFWCVTVGQVDLDGLAQDRDQLWAEAVRLYRDGARWHLDSVLARAAAQAADERVAPHPWLQLVHETAQRLLHDDELAGGVTDEAEARRKDVTPGEVLRGMGVRTEQQNPKSAALVGELLCSHGWVRGTRHRTRGQIFLPPPPLA